MLPPDKDDAPGPDPAPRDPASPQAPGPRKRARRAKPAEQPAAETAAVPDPLAPTAEDVTPTDAGSEAPLTLTADAAEERPAAPLWPWTEEEAQPLAVATAPEERVVAREVPRELPRRSQPPREERAFPRDIARDAPKQSEPVAGPTLAPAQPAPPPPPPPTQPRSRGGFWSGLLGALCGAALGAGAAWYVLDRRPQEPDPEMTANTAAIDRHGGEIAAQSERLASMQGDIESLSSALSSDELGSAVDAVRVEADTRFNDLNDTLTAVATRVDAAEARLGEIDERIAGLGTRLDQGDERTAALEARPIADPETANQALRSEVAAMRQEVEQATETARAQVETMRGELAAAAELTQAGIAEAQRRAEELEAQAQERARAAAAEAETAAQAAEARAALAQVTAALDTGGTFAGALAALGSGAEVPAALAAAADRGVPTLATLRETYPDAARAALAASRTAAAGGAPGGRVGAFLRTQVQARSLTPQEGSTPDAVLSRAEAALGRGDVAATLAELDALPGEGRAAMQGWIDEARIRADAVAAAASLSQDMN